jgi:7-cyano-7-deazaguanine synthase
MARNVLESGHASAVLFSGGLDSAVLLALERRDFADVWPIHVRAGLAWETAEAAAIADLLVRPPFRGRIHDVRTLTVDMRDIYPETHWAVTGRPPAYDTPDEDVYLDGRNLVLISKAAVLCARLGVSRLALGPLAGNPFPDATPEFFAGISRAASLGLAHPIDVVAPLSALSKAAVVTLGVELGVPLERTLSCMNPTGSRHCGRCSKCRERIDAFREAGIEDTAGYASTWDGSGG